MISLRAGRVAIDQSPDKVIILPWGEQCENLGRLNYHLKTFNRFRARWENFFRLRYLRDLKMTHTYWEAASTIAYDGCIDHLLRPWTVRPLGWLLRWVGWEPREKKGLPNQNVTSEPTVDYWEKNLIRIENESGNHSDISIIYYSHFDLL
jgi:hypothetical protein